MHNKAFINCPYDKEYKNFFEIIVFFCAYFDCEPCFASEDVSSGPRYEKIIDMIQNTSIGIHDISRVSLSDGLPRFNMAFELGLDSMHSFEIDKEKTILVLDGHENDYKKTISDLNCSDIKAHNNDEITLLNILRSFFIKHNMLSDVQSTKSLMKMYKLIFKSWLSNNLSNNGFDNIEIEMSEYKNKVLYFLNNNKEIVRPR